MVRKFITDKTLNKVKKFLKEQKKPISKSKIVKQLGVDFYSLNIALEKLNVKIKNGVSWE